MGSGGQRYWIWFGFVNCAMLRECLLGGVNQSVGMCFWVLRERHGLKIHSAGSQQLVADEVWLADDSTCLSFSRDTTEIVDRAVLPCMGPTPALRTSSIPGPWALETSCTSPIWWHSELLTSLCRVSDGCWSYGVRENHVIDYINA